MRQRPVLETLQRELDAVNELIDANQAQQASLSADLVSLRAQKADLKAAVDFLKARQTA